MKLVQKFLIITLFIILLSGVAFNSTQASAFEDNPSIDYYNADLVPGNWFDDAPVIDDGSYSGMSIEEGNDHFFAVELDEGDDLTASIYFSYNAGNLDLQVISPEKETYGVSESTTDDETVTITAEQSGLYYILVYGPNLDDGTNYDLEVSTITSEPPSSTDDSEPPSSTDDSEPEPRPSSTYGCPSWAPIIICQVEFLLGFIAALMTVIIFVETFRNRL